MKITNLKIRKLYASGNLRAVVSITFDDCFVIHDIKIIEHMEKLFIVMPSKKKPDGAYRDIAHPINSEFRTIIEEAVMEEYNKRLAEAENDESLFTPHGNEE